MTTKTAVLESTEEQVARLKMSYEEFRAWADEDVHAEWVNGEVSVYMPASKLHQLIVNFLSYLLNTFIMLHNTGQLFTAPFEMKLSDNAYREPDLLFVAQENADRVQEKRVEGPADFVIEIVSQSSVKRDRDEKFREYCEAGIREYWIIDPRPDKQRADFYHLNAAGEYVLFATEDDARVDSRILEGFWLNPSWLWQVETINPVRCALEIDSIHTGLADEMAHGREQPQKEESEREA